MCFFFSGLASVKRDARAVAVHMLGLDDELSRWLERKEGGWTGWLGLDGNSGWIPD